MPPERSGPAGGRAGRAGRGWRVGARRVASVRAATVALVATALLLGPAVGASGTAAATPGAAAVDGSPPSAPADATSAIDLVQELSLTPADPGEIRVTLRYRIPSAVLELRTRVPTGATVTSTQGFAPVDGEEYAWLRGVETASITYRLPVNETLDTAGPIAGTGDYTFVDAGPWALVRVPQTPTRWRSSGTVDLRRTTAVAGAGAVGDAIAFLGPHRTVTRTAHGQTVRLVVPDRATLAAPPADVLDSITAASDALRVGDRDDEVFVVAAPTRSVQWGVLGLQTGDADMWVQDDERLDTAGNVWLHEYVHTRQEYEAASDARWVTEATAVYYAALLTLRQDRVGFAAFRDRLALGTRTPDRSAVLDDPATWKVVAPYTKGALVAGELDRRIRLATDGSRSLQGVVARLNAHDGTVTAATVRGAVGAVGGDDAAALATRYASTTAVPSTWDRAAHARAFDAPLARMAYALPGAAGSSGPSTGYRVTGRFRNASLDPPLRLATGETLAVDVRVRNAGDAAGAYDARLLVDGDPVDARTGDLAPGASATVTLAYRFTTPGTHTLAVGDESVTVEVRPPAAPTVETVEATTRPRDDGARVVVTATVRNGATVPAAGTLTLSRDDAPVERVPVALAPGAERTVRFAETTVGPSRHVFAVGGRTAVVTVSATPTAGSPTARSPTTGATPTPSPDRPARTWGDGFGAGVALAALAALACLGALAASRRRGDG